MKPRVMVRVFVLVFVLSCVCPNINGSASAQTPQAINTAAADSAITGVWRGQDHGLPAVALVVTDEGGSLTGAVQFYLLKRETANDPWTSAPGLPEPMLRPEFAGQTLAFQISHRRSHPPRTLSDPPVHYRLTLTGPNQATLATGSDGGLSISLVRSDY
jgi:hypothetical protein